MFSWFNTKAVDDCAASLTADFAARYPVSVDGGKGTAAPNRLEQALVELYARAEKFHREQNLGLYKKAKLANAIKWHLRELGYDNDLVEKISKTIAIRLAAKPAKVK